MTLRLIPVLLVVALSSPSLAEYDSKTVGEYPVPKESYGSNEKDLDADGKSVNDPGMDGTSKACRYDDGPGWTDCDPFELVRFRVLRLIHGGSQCEEVKNITKHCTPHDFPHGTHWLIQEHRKCIAELGRLKAMIADLYKHIETIHQKGKQLFEAYLKLKAKLEALTITLEKLKKEGEHQEEALKKVKDEIEEWKNKARELQVQLDELKAKYHDLEAEEHELNLKNEQLATDINVLVKENESIALKIEKLIKENAELNRRIVEAEHIKEKIADKKAEKAKLAAKLEKLNDKLEQIRDDLAECKIKLLGKQTWYGGEDLEYKDTHVDLNMEMIITHNKTVVYKPTVKPIYYSTEKYYKYESPEPKCLISYYGYTNETCWYETDTQKSEDSYVDALGHHLVEAHWKYFTINVKDQYECDKASHLHYEFLINRCTPKHYLPVLSIFRPSDLSQELGTHIYPKPQIAEENKCWITFLGAHGHCERHKTKFPLYNTNDIEKTDSKETCLARAKYWQEFCDTPVIVTYVPDEVSTNWQESWIMHDGHGGRMFEEVEDAKNQINPDSLIPNAANPSKYKSEYKSVDPKTPDYHDSPEYRKSLNLEGKEKEEILQKLRERLGMKGKAGSQSSNVLTFVGPNTSASSSEESSEESKEMPAPADSYKTYEAPAPYSEAPKTEAPYAPPETQAPYVAETEAPYVPETEAPYVAPETEAPYVPETEAPYVAPTEAPYTTAAPYVPPETEAPYVPPETEAPYAPPETEAPYVAPTEAPADPYAEPPKYEAPPPDETYVK